MSDKPTWQAILIPCVDRDALSAQLDGDGAWHALTHTSTAATGGVIAGCLTVTPPTLDVRIV
jgi:hypothetical protein